MKRGAMSELFPLLLDLDFRAAAACARGGSGGGDTVVEEGFGMERPVRRVTALRMLWLRQRMVRVMRAGRECQLIPTVPRTRIVRFVVMM